MYQYYKEFCQWERIFFEAQQRREEMRNRSLQAMAHSNGEAENGAVDEEVEEAREGSGKAAEEAIDAVDEALKQINLNVGKSDEPDESTA